MTKPQLSDEQSKMKQLLQAQCALMRPQKGEYRLSELMALEGHGLTKYQLQGIVDKLVEMGTMKVRVIGNVRYYRAL